MRASTARGARAVEIAAVQAAGHTPIQGYPAHPGCGGALTPITTESGSSSPPQPQLRCSICDAIVGATAAQVATAKDAEGRYRAAAARGSKPARFAQLTPTRRSGQTELHWTPPALLEGGPILLARPAPLRRGR
jgi:hypothetical protein